MNLSMSPVIYPNVDKQEAIQDLDYAYALLLGLVQKDEERGF